MTCFSVFLQSRYNCLMSNLFACHSASLCWQRCLRESSAGAIDGVESIVEVASGDMVPGEIEDIATPVLEYYYHVLVQSLVDEMRSRELENQSNVQYK